MARGDAFQYLVDVVLNYSGDECLYWPFGRIGGGYGQVNYEGRQHYVHRVVCEKTHGPSEGLDAAHSCGNGHLGCVNPRHLSWKTRGENVADARAHGTIARGERNGRAKISEDDARNIRALRGLRSQSALARQYSIDQSTVSDIQTGKRWGWL